MRVGAVAMVDALGFKGIWNRNKPDAVLSALRQLKRSTEDAAVRLQSKDTDPLQRKADVRLEIDCAFISDTVVIAVSAEGGSIELPASACAVVYAAWMSSHVTATAAALHVPLAYRGCIAYGQFELEETFVIGPAIDEAAENHEIAEGAFIWLTPSARHEFGPFERYRDGRAIRRILFDYKVPMKGGLSFDTLVVSPFGNAPEPQVLPLSEALVSTFSERPLSVAIKRQHTFNFLAHDLQRLKHPGLDGGVGRLLRAVEEARRAPPSNRSAEDAEGKRSVRSRSVSHRVSGGPGASPKKSRRS